MRAVPIRTREQLVAAVASPQDPTSWWYLERVAKALGATDVLPESWGAHQPDFRVQTPEQAEEITKADGHYAGVLEELTSDDTELDDAVAMVAALGAKHHRDGIFDEVAEVFDARVYALVEADRLSPYEQQALTAGIRRVRTAEGAKKYGQSLHSIIVTDPDEVAKKSPLAHLDAPDQAPAKISYKKAAKKVVSKKAAKKVAAKKVVKSSPAKLVPKKAVPAFGAPAKKPDAETDNTAKTEIPKYSSLDWNQLDTGSMSAKFDGWNIGVSKKGTGIISDPVDGFETVELPDGLDLDDHMDMQFAQLYVYSEYKKQKALFDEKHAEANAQKAAPDDEEILPEPDSEDAPNAPTPGLQTDGTYLPVKAPLTTTQLQEFEDLEWHEYESGGEPTQEVELANGWSITIFESGDVYAYDPDNNLEYTTKIKPHNMGKIDPELARMDAFKFAENTRDTVSGKLQPKTPKKTAAKKAGPKPQPTKAAPEEYTTFEDNSPPQPPSSEPVTSTTSVADLSPGDQIWEDDEVLEVVKVEVDGQNHPVVTWQDQYGGAPFQNTYYPEDGDQTVEVIDQEAVPGAKSASPVKKVSVQNLKAGQEIMHEGQVWTVEDVRSGQDEDFYGNPIDEWEIELYRGGGDDGEEYQVKYVGLTEGTDDFAEKSQFEIYDPEAELAALKAKEDELSDTIETPDFVPPTSLKEGDKVYIKGDVHEVVDVRENINGDTVITFEREDGSQHTNIFDNFSLPLEVATEDNSADAPDIDMSENPMVSAFDLQEGDKVFINDKLVTVENINKFAGDVTVNYETKNGSIKSKLFTSKDPLLEKIVPKPDTTVSTKQVGYDDLQIGDHVVENGVVKKVNSKFNTSYSKQVTWEDAQGNLETEMYGVNESPLYAVTDKPLETPKPSTTSKAPSPASAEDLNSAVAAPKFVGGQQVKYGELNPGAKGNDPERFEPKVSLADGIKPETGMKVMDKDGNVGTVVETYQAYTLVRFPDNLKGKSINNKKLNKFEPAQKSGPPTGSDTSHFYSQQLTALRDKSAVPLHPELKFTPPKSILDLRTVQPQDRISIRPDGNKPDKEFRDLEVMAVIVNKAGEPVEIKYKNKSYYGGESTVRASDIVGFARQDSPVSNLHASNPPDPKTQSTILKAKQKNDFPDTGAEEAGFPRTTNQALRSEYGSTVNNLTYAQRSAFESYAGNGYVAMNTALRNADEGELPPTNNVNKQVDRMHQAMAKHPLAEPITVHRLANHANMNMAGLVPGAVYVDKGFVSASTHTDASVFSGLAGKDADVGLTMEIRIPAGTHAMYLDAGNPPLSTLDERELLIDYGYRYRVISNINNHLVVELIPKPE